MYRHKGRRRLTVLDAAAQEYNSRPATMPCILSLVFIARTMKVVVPQNVISFEQDFRRSKIYQVGYRRHAS